MYGRGTEKHFVYHYNPVQYEGLDYAIIDYEKSILVSADYSNMVFYSDKNILIAEYAVENQASMKIYTYESKILNIIVYDDLKY